MPLSLDSILEVTELNQYVGMLLKQDPVLRSVRVKGEISGFKAYSSSGHWYFSLKDRDAKIDCAMFRGYNAKSSIFPENGQMVIVSGYIDLFIRDGKYQLIVTAMRPEGKGDLLRQFEELKQKLQAEGLFDASRKKKLPFLPRKIAVVTSASGAVYHDICNVSKLRNPLIPIVLIPSAVQGKGSEYEIAEGLRIAWNIPDVDVIIVGRGGGSVEDLWCFNEEIVARTVAECPLPVISAVGHETDFTICDFAADVRASTPSNAAEIAVPGLEDLTRAREQLYTRLGSGMMRRISDATVAVMLYRNRMENLNPEVCIRKQLQKCSEYSNRLNVRMQQRLDGELQRTGTFRINMDHRMDIRIRNDEFLIDKCREQLKTLSPYAVLERGYSIVFDENGNPVLSASETDGVERMNVMFHDGTITVRKDGREDENL